MRIILLLMCIICIYAPLSAQTTREGVIVNATTEAGRTYSSAPSFSPELDSNINNSKYKDGKQSPLFIAIDTWIFDYLEASWSGAPYCYGNHQWKDECQENIDDGDGLGAREADYYHNLWDTETWAAGIDCSFFVCKCFESNYYNTTALADSGEATTIFEIQPADLLVNPGCHS